MSYILEALKRADAERERGAVPGIYAQPVYGRSAGSDSSETTRPWIWALVLLPGVLIAAAAGYWYFSSTGSGTTATAPASPVVVLPAPVTAPPQASAPPAVEAGPAPASAPVATAPSLAADSNPPAPMATVPAPATGLALPAPASIAIQRAPFTPAAMPKPVAAAPAFPAMPSKGIGPKPEAAPIERRLEPAAPARLTAPGTPLLQPPVNSEMTSGSTPADSKASAPGAVAVDSRIYELKELPDDIRRQLPSIVIEGLSYTSTPANRMLVVDGQVFHEGNEIAPGVTLQQIKLRAVVLLYKGYRYHVGF